MHFYLVLVLLQILNWFRHLFGKLYIWHGLLAGTVDGFISIRLERGSRLEFYFELIACF